MNRWQQVEKLCQSALELEEGQRKAFVQDACAGDEELRREVESLLGFDGRGERFIEAPKMVDQEKLESLDVGCTARWANWDETATLPATKAEP